MKRTLISSGGPYEEKIGYSRAVVCDGWVFVSGSTGSDPDTGEMHAMVYAPAQWMDHIQYVVVGTDGRVRKALDIPLGMTMVHDMSLTARYAVVYDQPCTVDIDLALAGRFPFRWNPEYGNRLGLLPREGSADDIVWIDVPLGYVFHPMNAFDDGDGNVRSNRVR